MPRKRKELGRPVRPYPPRIDATAEEIAQVFLRTAPPRPAINEDATYCCTECGREVNYPEILYRDGCCAEHTTRSIVG